MLLQKLANDEHCSSCGSFSRDSVHMFSLDRIVACLLAALLACLPASLRSGTNTKQEENMQGGKDTDFKTKCYHKGTPT